MLRLWMAMLLVFMALAAQAQTIIMHDTIRLRDTSVIVTPIEPSSVAKSVRGIVANGDDEDDGDARSHFFSDSIQSKGYISQSFASGNRRDLSPNTTADLSVSAVVAGGVEVKADILDSDMPMDDEGVTNQINELSSILITAKKDSTMLSVGDIVANNDINSLSRFSKKIKGVEFATVNGLRDGDTISVRTDFAATKGKFRRQQIFGQDNSQGPYYLHAEDSAVSVIVLVGTEKVWLDGTLLARGGDYEIDYNSGTIEFNVRHIITRQSVITVDFEYSETQYDNYFLYADAAYKTRRLSFKSGYLTEYDGLGSVVDSVAADTAVARPRKIDYVFFDIGARVTPTTMVGVETMLSKIVADRMRPTETSTQSMALIAKAQHDFFADDTARSMVVKSQLKYLSENFQPLVTEKDIKFQEKWDLEDYQPGLRELFSETSFLFSNATVNAAYTLSTAKIDGMMDGHAHSMTAGMCRGRFMDTVSVDFFSDIQSGSRHDYLSAVFQSQYKLDSLTLGASFAQKSRSLHDSSNANFRDISVFAVRHLRKGHVGLTATDRTTFGGFWDGGGVGGARLLTAELQVAAKEKYSLRALEILRKDRDDESATLAGSLAASCQLFDHQLVLSATQQSVRGNQEQLAYRYIRTTTGNGHYTWIDYDGDGVEDLDEFEVSYYKTDADYVKYFVHTGQYVSTLQNDLGFNAMFHGKGGRGRLSDLMSRLSVSATFDIQRQDARRGGGSFFTGDSLISQFGRQRYTSRLRLWDFLFIGNDWSSSRQERFTFYGFESNSNDASGFFLEFDSKFGLGARYQRTFKNQRFTSEYFPEKCYRIHAVCDEVDTKYDFGNGVTATLGVSLCRKSNRTDTTLANVRALNLGFAYAHDAKGSASLNYRLVKNLYDGDLLSSSASYQMLEGLAVGYNDVVTVSASYMLTKYLQLSLLYELRAAPDNTLHTGEMELKVVF